jgi:hypothetical protein
LAAFIGFLGMTASFFAITRFFKYYTEKASHVHKYVQRISSIKPEVFLFIIPLIVNTRMNKGVLQRRHFGEHLKIFPPNLQ